MHAPHQQTDAGGIEFFNFQFARDAAAAHDQDAVSQGAHFFQFHRHQQDRHALIAQGQQLAVDALDGANVDAAGGWPTSISLGWASTSRAITTFC